MAVTTRREAKLQGLARYSTGEPCQQGHCCDRYTTTALCVLCVKERSRVNFLRKQRNIMRKRLFSMVSVTVTVPHGDEAALRAYAEQLIKAREAKRDYKALG
jgi:hypothetical protein